MPLWSKGWNIKVSVTAHFLQCVIFANDKHMMSMCIFVRDKRERRVKSLDKRSGQTDSQGILYTDKL